MYLWRFKFCYGLFLLCSKAAADTKILYDTKKAKSDLKWEKHPATGWEELSGLDENGQPIRFQQVCRNDLGQQNNWIRSPFIESDFARRAYVDVTYSMIKCSTCRETFTLYYYQSNDDIASSTFPPWRERPYIKIDTVAAGNHFDSNSNSEINIKTFNIGPLTRKGFYIAAQDEGACMSLIAVRVYYNYCPETTYGLAYYPRTLPGAEIASLIPIDGKCVTNAVYKDGETPKYRCNIDGEWQVPTGACQCRSGYQPNVRLTACEACPQGFYKGLDANVDCSICPPNSESNSLGATSCPCIEGYYRAKGDTLDKECIEPASEPFNVTAKVSGKVAMIRWQQPLSGSKRDLYFTIGCFECGEDDRSCDACPSSIRFSPSVKKLLETSVNVSGLHDSSAYKLQVFAHNAVGIEKPAFSTISFATHNVPSKPQDVKILQHGRESILVSWNAPAISPNNVKEYEIEWTSFTGKNGDVEITRNLIVTGVNATLDNLLPGALYEIKVRAKGSKGVGPYSYPQSWQVEYEDTEIPKPPINIIVACIAVAVVLALAVVVIILVKRKRSRKKKRTKERDPEETKPFTENELDGCAVVYLPPVASGSSRPTYSDYRDPYKGVKEMAKQIDAKMVIIEKVIGVGEFGEVCKGKLRERNQLSVVAIKRLRQEASLTDQTGLLREACTMAQFKHSNILQLKGVVMKGVPTMIISEYMENGSLDKLLQTNRGRFTAMELVRMLHGISSGMRYLSDMQYVHRDLAARNILVDENYVCKIADFGLSRNIENDPHATYTTQGGKIPIRWTAPECIRLRQFTSASDTWSYGIVMWEVMSFGEKPYWDMTNEHVTESIENGFRLPAPQGCPRALHRLMLDCWSYDSSARPTFREIFVRLKKFVNQPELLTDCSQSNIELLGDGGSEISTRTLTVGEWLEYLKLGSYSQRFQDHGIQDLSEVAQLSAEDMERLGIDQDVHRTRLRSGIETLQHTLTSNRRSLLEHMQCNSREDIVDQSTS